ncbi:hypothetical protein ACFXG4_42760 [Nocardia sp. NPDC059246]|uniref:hypothetical protein n=1 Tax=unclassified Nocardia TaxID=2637762 RepID=UPI0036963C58
MARQRRKHPARGAVRLILQTFGVKVLVDFMVEFLTVRMSAVTMPRLISGVGSSH